jgi:hypothetical protein
MRKSIIISLQKLNKIIPNQNFEQERRVLSIWKEQEEFAQKKNDCFCQKIRQSSRIDDNCGARFVIL